MLGLLFLTVYAYFTWPAVLGLEESRKQVRATPPLAGRSFYGQATAFAGKGHSHVGAGLEVARLESLRVLVGI